MNLVQLAIAVAVAVIVLWIAVKYWKAVLGLAVVGLLTGAVLCAMGAVDCPFGNGNSGNKDDGSQGGTQPQDRPPSVPPSTRFPDFVIEGVQQNPSGSMQPRNSTIQYRVRVANRGNAAWDGYIVVQGPGNAQGGFRGLRPGETKEAMVPLHAGSSGQITVGNIYFRVDPDNITRESNENNNQAGPFSVTFY